MTENYKLTMAEHGRIIGLMRRAYPTYRGRKFAAEITEHPIDAASYWDGGSRDYFRFIRLADGATWEAPAQSAFDRPVSGLRAVIMPAGVVCVRHSLFCGRDCGLALIINPHDAEEARIGAQKMLPAVV